MDRIEEKQKVVVFDQKLWSDPIPPPPMRCLPLFLRRPLMHYLENVYSKIHGRIFFALHILVGCEGGWGAGTFGKTSTNYCLMSLEMVLIRPRLEN